MQRAETSGDAEMPLDLANAALNDSKPGAAPAWTLPMQAAWAADVAAYARAVAAAGVNDAHAARLLEAYWQDYEKAWAVIGPDRARVMADLLTRDARNTGANDGRSSAFATPDASLAAANDWLAFIEKSGQLRHRARLNGSHDRVLALALSAAAPAPLEPLPVLRNARWIVQAARKTSLPPEVLAAIVDNEQSGGRLAYGLSSALRGVADTLALRAARQLGDSGPFGRLSRTIGLAQMSWQDALAQKPRFHALGLAFGVAFPRTEVEARVILGQPYANLLLSASRLRGYLNDASHRPNLDTAPYGVNAYAIGPAWHNRPDLASSGQTFPYEFNAFFKACLYAGYLGGTNG
ncbi:MAG TPA: hypothetical protein VHN99_03365 [Deinococcales bacterium]|nr:hypothetical protein [Deinococcales bacterium]